MADVDVESSLSKLDAVKDVLTVKRVFGDVMEVDGVAVIPVAKVKGGSARHSSSPPVDMCRERRTRRIVSP